MLQVHCFST